jgi:cytochrome P450
MTTATVEFNPFLPEFIADPYPFYRRLREQDPIHRSGLGFWVLTRYDDVVTLLRDPRFGRDRYQPLLRARFGDEATSGSISGSMLFRDPPDHTRLRGLVSKAFTPRAVETMRPHIQRIVDELLDAVRDARAMDVIADLAYPLPVIVICEMLGVPVADRGEFRQWSVDIGRSLDAIATPSDPAVIERGNAARRALTDYFRTLLAERRARPRGDLLSALIAAEEAGERLSEGELLATCVLLFVAGHETTVNLIGNGLLALLRHPDATRGLREDPSLIVPAVEELLRYDGPVQRTGRIANVDAEIDGRPIAEGTLVLGLIGAANRDPAHFPEPDRLDFRRADKGHLAFGWGIHFCLGAPLARVEGQIALGTLTRRLRGLTFTGTAPEWRESATLRGLQRLPVAWEGEP